MTDIGLEGWGEYKRLILQELERLAKRIEDLDSKIDRFRGDDIASLKVEVAMLKVKAGMWGALAGAVPAAIAIIWGLVSK
jgi:hypothetical protein